MLKFTIRTTQQDPLNGDASNEYHQIKIEVPEIENFLTKKKPKGWNGYASVIGCELFTDIEPPNEV